MEGITLPRPPSPHWKREPSDSAALSQRRKGNEITPLSSYHPNGAIESRSPHPPKSADYIYQNRRKSADQPHRNLTDSYPQPLSATRATMPSMTSPSTAGGVFSGPPPPYSYHASNPHTDRNGYASPPNLSAAHDEKGPRHSLPPLLEALNKDPYQYGGPPSSIPPPPPHSTQSCGLPPPTTSSQYHPASSPKQRPRGESTYSSHQAPLPPYSHETTDSKHHPPSRQGSQYGERGQPAYSASTATPERVQSPHILHPPAQSSPTHPPSSQAYSSSTHPSTSYPSSSSSSFPPSSRSHTAASSYPSTTYPPSNHNQSMAPIPPPAYRNYQPAYSYPPPTNTFAAVNTPQWQPERSDPVDDARKAAAAQQKQGSGNQAQQQHYGEAVKRHLDIFDLESSLNEMAEGCGRGLNFARHFGSQASAHTRAGPPLTALPRITECDDMIHWSERVLSSVTRVREFVLAQQHAEQEQQQAAQAQQRDLPSEPRGEDPNDREKREGGGFAGGDAKKRRGRNAPPGRCHSCNRAETPEWRRGPDGARTLCNACGLRAYDPHLITRS